MSIGSFFLRASRYAWLVIAAATVVVGMQRAQGEAAATGPATAPAASEATGKLRVLVKPAEPFSFEKNGQITGYSVELWKRVADQAGLTFEMKMVKTVPEMLSQLEHGQADVGVGAISVTQDRERVLDFSHPFFESGLQILAPRKGSGSAFAAFDSLFRGDVLLVIGLGMLAIFVVSNILWLAERRHNEEMFPRRYGRGVWEAAWWSASTIISGGCENKSANTVPGRLVAVVWMLGGIGLTSYITATLAAAMTVHNLTNDIRSIADLKGQAVATVGGSSTEDFLQRQGFKPRKFPDVNAAIDSLTNGEVKAVVYDSPMLRYYLTTHAESPLELTGEKFDRQNYSFALPLGSPYRKQINEALLKLELDGFPAELDKKWFAGDTQ